MVRIEQHRALEAHVVIPDDAAPRMTAVKERIKRLPEDDFDITHSTLELEFASDRCGDSSQLVPEHA